MVLDLAGGMARRGSEHEHAVGLDHALEGLLVTVDGIAIDEELDGFGHLTYGLMELDLGRVLGDDVRHQLVDVPAHDRFVLLVTRRGLPKIPSQEPDPNRPLGRLSTDQGTTWFRLYVGAREREVE